jgi:hypothetical protein
VLGRAKRAAVGRVRRAVGEDGPPPPAWLSSPFLTWMPPGHFYSAIPDLDEVTPYLRRLEDAPPAALPGVDLADATQLEWLARLGGRVEGFVPPRTAEPGWRYWTENPSLNLGDALVVQAMLREVRPQRVVEVGSGWSSAVMLDTAERFLTDQAPLFTFVEPYADALRTVLRPEDLASVHILEQPVQDVDPAVFEQLGAGDVLFIDCSHVAKVGSDVLHIYLEVLPRLAAGVIVHVHDIFFPFEYPLGWVAQGRAWSEAYLLRALLVGGQNLEILFWADYLAERHAAAAKAALPPIAEYFDGRWHMGSIWLRRR